MGTYTITNEKYEQQRLHIDGDPKDLNKSQINLAYNIKCLSEDKNQAQINIAYKYLIKSRNENPPFCLDVKFEYGCIFSSSNKIIETDVYILILRLVECINSIIHQRGLDYKVYAPPLTSEMTEDILAKIDIC